MSRHERHTPPTGRMTRRHWGALVLSQLAAACGGGDPGTGGTGVTVGLPGTGGTGSVFVLGPITGLGSVWVNGVRYDDSQAAVTIDGQTVNASELRVGMVVSLQGQRDATAALGTASAVDSWVVARGRVSSVSASGFTVNGVRLATDGATTWDGVADLAALSVGQWVSVWGLQLTSEGADWSATRVAVLPAAPATVVSTGRVSLRGSATLNGLAVTAPGTPLADGQLVSLTGTLSGAQALQVSSARLIESGTTPPVSHDGLEASATGVVSAVLGSGRYLVGTVEVDSSANAGATPVVGQRVEIEGTWAGNVLKVKSLEVRDVEQLSEVELDGVVEQFRGVADFVVRGQRCNASQAAFGNGKPAQLKVGAKVKLHGRKQGDLLIVTELEFGD